MRGRRRWVLLAGVLVLVLLVTAGGVVGWRRLHPPDQMSIPADDPADSSAPFPGRGTSTTAPAEGPGYVTDVAAGGRYLLDQYGQPLLVAGDSPWSMLTDLSPDQVQVYLDDRQQHDVNALIVSLIGARRRWPRSPRGHLRRAPAVPG